MEQAGHIYKKVELEGIVNVDTIKEEIGEDKLSKDNIVDEEEVNPHHNMVVNNIDRGNVITSQMEQCSILSNIVNRFYDLDVKTIDQRNHRKIYDRLKDEDRQVLELDFGDNADKL